MMSENRPLLLVNLLLFVFCGGIFCAGKLPISMACVVGAIIFLFFGAAILFWRKQKQAELVLLVLFFCLGFLRCSHDSVVLPSDIRHSIGTSATIVGKVCTAPRIEMDEAGLVYLRYVVAVEEIKGKQYKQVTGKIIVYIKQKAALPIARYGDEIRVNGEIRALHGYRNPGRLDTEAALERQGISAKMQAVKNSAVVVPINRFFVQRIIDLMRDKLLAAMNQAMPPQDAAALFAMLFGGYGGIKPELLEAFTATGIVHILSVSGSHIALLAGTLQQIGGLLRIRPVVTAIGIVLAVFFYALFSGCVPPVVRSAVMGILAFAALVLGREKDACRILSLVGLGMLVFSPQLIYDISFQLSFGATAGLLYLAPVVCGWLGGIPKLPKWLAANLALTIAAQISVLPFLAWYFNTVSLSSLLANLIAVPVVEYVIVLGLLGAVAGAIVPFLQNIFFVLCSLSLGLVYNITRIIAVIPGGTLYLPAGGILFGAVYYAGLVFLGGGVSGSVANYWFGISSKRRIVFAGVILAIGLIGFLSWRTEPVRVHFIDVGQGDAALVTTPHGNAVLIDTGGVLRAFSDFDIGERVILPYLKHYGVRKLDYLILTHAHEDHAGGAAAVCRIIPVDHVIIGREDRREYARAFLTSLEHMPNGIPAYTGQKIQVDGVDFNVLQATDASSSGTGNEVSNVIQIVYGKHRFLITGDLDGEGEERLLKTGTDVQSSVLKVAHHGSKTSSTEAFIQKVNPAYAVISVGADNRFGHPSSTVIERLEAQQAKIYRTDRDGAIIAETDGKKLKITTFMKNR